MSYREQVDRENILQLCNLIKDLPPFHGDLFHGIESRTSSRTRIVHAYDLHVFFDFLHRENPTPARVTVRDIELDQLDQLPATDSEEYVEYLRYRFNDKSQEAMNRERGIVRKISSLESFYSCYYRNEQVKNNPAALAQLPKPHEKETIRLDVDEVALFLGEVEQDDGLTNKQKNCHAKTKTQDPAFLTLLLGTRIRMSGCVGLNISDIDFRDGGIHIYHKGSKGVIIYFGAEVKDTLLDYLEERDRIISEQGHENTLFPSLQCRRAVACSVENPVRKYVHTVAPLKSITPHKLCNTYGTNLHRETSNVCLVADVLGHFDVNITKRHYAALEDERRRSVRNKVRFREKQNYGTEQK